jgi:predicted site-specific integrase-resolvase
MTATWSKARGSGTARRGKRLIVYVRVSLIGDRGDDLISDDVQLDVCKRWAKREGMTIVDVVSDLDLSGREFTKRKITKCASGNWVHQSPVRARRRDMVMIMEM